MNFKSILMAVIPNSVRKLYFSYLKIWKSNIFKEECKMSYCGMKTRHEKKMAQAPRLVSSSIIGWFHFGNFDLIP